jgi:hypothetical protein
LFQREAELKHQQVIPLWELAADQIEALGIEVLEEGCRPLPVPLRVCIEGHEAIFGLVSATAAAPTTTPASAG